MLWIVGVLVAIASTGCTSMTPGPLERVQAVSNQPRVGNVYLLRGWIGVFSYGINDLTTKINRAGVRANVYQDDQWDSLGEKIRERYVSAPRHEPLVLIGHSYGADDVLRVSQRLGAAGITVDLVVTLDPVSPPEVPANVRRCYNLYQSNAVLDKLPMFHGIPLTQAVGSHGELKNLDVRKDRTDLLEPGTNHFNIEKKGKIHDEVLKEVLATCPPRGKWKGATRVQPFEITPASSTQERTAAAAQKAGPVQTSRATN